MSSTADILLITSCWAHVLLAPFTKVEESFNLHATHDVLMYGVYPGALGSYDHFVFPGAVPRTLLGSVLLAWLSTPFIKLACHFGFLASKFAIQIALRLVLATCNAITFCLLRRAVSRKFGGNAGLLFALLTCTQFHLPFWVGRTLPNMFALVPVNIASYLLIGGARSSTKPTQRDLYRAITLLTSTAVIFRSEVALLLGPIILQLLFFRQTSLSKTISVGIFAGVFSMAVTVFVDSYFWQQWPLWPELYGIYFNVYQGKSSEWGVSPFHTYFTSYLPKLLLGSLPLAFLGFLIDSRIRSLMIPAITFVILLSKLAHKEWRFIVYVIPVFNIAAARGATWMTSRKKAGIFGKVCFLIVVGLICGDLLVTSIFIRSSMANYPGGEALHRLNTRYAIDPHVHVHISNLAAQTGASLFLQTRSPPEGRNLGVPPPLQEQHWIYNKTENLNPKSITAAKDITHVIAECHSGDMSGVSGTGFPVEHWKQVDVIRGFQRWAINPTILQNVDGLFHFWDVLVMVETDELAILERR